MAKPELKILLTSPRGFCAGVDRAIQIVEGALERFGAPVYVRHEIVHNRHVVESLEDKGAIFVEDLDEIPDDATVIFSAHGVPKAVTQEATRRELFYLDATCPLVSKVHHEAEHHFAAGRQILLIGHTGHPEVEGTIGQLPEGAILLIETREQAESVEVRDPENLAYLTQTTLSIDDTADIVQALMKRFPGIQGPSKSDICYATANRQRAVKEIASRCDVLIVIGAPNSSNSSRLVEVAALNGCPRALLVQRAADIDWDSMNGIKCLGITAGASAPEVLIEGLLDACRQRFEVSLEEVSVIREEVRFSLPRELTT
ncbi:MAG: 4-hydroxy-3-methylbut-2-enyl diphosphate reductase [Alphaproteobacteria bacterium]|nr:MAG: 4-hydroxy-3-methylbut-2-enyl diphosphate reductase [Alphaproteobacteria bacterium]